MKQVVLFVCMLHLFACAAINRPHTRSTIAFQQIESQCSNLDIIVFDENSNPLPGISVIIRSGSNNRLIWQGTTGMTGHIQLSMTVTDLIITAGTDGFFSHEQQITIPNGKRCLLLIYTKPDPNFVFKVT